MKFLKENNYIFYKNYRMDKITTILSNEKCKYYIEVRNYQELYKLIDYLDKIKMKYLIIGNGSKIVFINNYRGVVISLKKLNKITIMHDLCEVEAGCLIINLINKLKSKNLGGIEELIGIPASIGGGLINNISAHGVQLSDYLIKVIVYKNNQIIELKKEDIIFNYRYSSLKNEYLVLKAIFKFKSMDKEYINENIKKYKEYRKNKQVTTLPNIGSIFKNNIKPANQIINDLKLNTITYKNISLSKKHSNFIEIKKKTKGKYIYKFVKKLKKRVIKLANINLESEIIFIKS